MIKRILILLLLNSHSFASTECTLDLNEVRKANDYNYLLVSGILNEFIPFYMNDFEDYLISLKVPKKQIIRVDASSLTDPMKASSSIANVVNKISNGKKVVFISHSKGALETLYYLNNEKDGYASKVEKAFLIQGSLDGSSLYRAFYDVKNLGYFRRAIKWIVSESFALPYDFRKVRKNLVGLKLKKKLLAKISFITSEVTYENLPLKYKMVGSLYQNSFNKAGDGILMRSDHVPFELKGEHEKHCIQNYDVHHAYLVCTAPWNRSHRQDIRDFLKSLLFKNQNYEPKYLKL
jgi:hypothetical protein